MIGNASKNAAVYFYLGVAGFLLVMFLLFAPTRTHFYNVDVPYEDVEYYFEKEPYDYQEEYEAQEPYQTTETYYDKVPVTKTETNTAPSGQHFSSCSGSCHCTRYSISYCVECTCDVVEYKTVKKERPVTKYKAVTKTRTSTGYRDVQKQRAVTKFRQEERQYETNWLFGFRVPWYIHLAYVSRSG